MKLFTKAQEKQLLKNGALANEERAGIRDKDKERKPVIKLFTCFSNATWLISEIDPERPDIAFGLCDLGFGTPELGSVSLAELAACRGPMGLGVERDRHWLPAKSLVEYANDARMNGSIAA